MSDDALFGGMSRAAHDSTMHEDVLALIHEVRQHQERSGSYADDLSDMDLWDAVDEIAVKYGL